MDKLLLSLAKCNLADAGGYGESKGRWTDSMDPITLTALSLVVRDSFLHYKQLNKCLVINCFCFNFLIMADINVGKLLHIPIRKSKKIDQIFPELY